MKKFETVFISDLHLGTKGCKIEYLTAFIKRVECKKIYLIGDIFDGWKLKRKWNFPQSHVNFIHQILKKAKNGTEVIYIPGNHDEFLRKFHYYDLDIGNVKIKNSDVYQTISGKRLIVVHGDGFDMVTLHHKWVAIFGDVAYNFIVRLNTVFNKCRKLLGMGYWSLSNFIKQKVKGAVGFITNFEESAVKFSKSRGYDGVILGHVHSPSLKILNSQIYLNDGCWTESCSWAAEDKDGNLELYEWNEGSPKLISRLKPYAKNSDNF